MIWNLNNLTSDDAVILSQALTSLIENTDLEDEAQADQWSEQIERAEKLLEIVDGIIASAAETT